MCLFGYYAGVDVRASGFHLSRELSRMNPQMPQDNGFPDFQAGNGSAAGGAGYGSYGYGSAATTPTSESDLSIVHYLQILYRRRYAAAAAFLAIVAAVALYTFTAVRVYEATARILIERDNPEVGAFDPVLNQNEITDDYYETQYRILQSRALARRTLDALGLWNDPQFTQAPRLSIRGVLMWPIAKVSSWFEPARPQEAPDAAETRAQ